MVRELVLHGYDVRACIRDDNLDFHQAGVTFGERCVVRWRLPDYPIRRIRTGQYVAVQAEQENAPAQRLGGGSRHRRMIGGAVAHPSVAACRL